MGMLIVSTLKVRCAYEWVHSCGVLRKPVTFEHIKNTIHCCCYWWFFLQTLSPCSMFLSGHTQMTAPSSSGLSTCMILILTGNWLVILNPNLKFQENGTNEPSLGRYPALSVVVYAESLMSCLCKCLGKGEWGREKTEDIPNVGITLFTFFITYLYSLRTYKVRTYSWA